MYDHHQWTSLNFPSVPLRVPQNSCLLFVLLETCTFLKVNRQILNNLLTFFKQNN